MITHHNFPEIIRNDSIGANPHLFQRIELTFWELFIRVISSLQALRTISPSTIFRLDNDDNKTLKRYWIITAVSGIGLGFVIGMLSL